MAKAKPIEVRILKSCWGKFNLPYTPGKDFKIEAKLAKELIREGFATATSEAKKLESEDSEEQTPE